MSSDQNKYGLGNLIGGTDLPRNANPTIRGTVRREDPDANPAPHFTGLSGTTLNLDYSPTGAQAIVFTSDDLAVAIADINAVDPTNLEAIDDSGYLRLRSLTGGSKNFLKIISGDAAPILGFRLDPLPGSASFSGEISTSPAGAQTGQNNPHGTALLAGDEDLSSAGINRAVIGALLHVERIAGDLDLETLVIKEVSVTVLAHPISGEKVFRLQDPTIRVPIRGFGISVSNPAAGLLDPQLMMMQVTGGQSHEFIDLDDATTFGRIVSVFYDDLTNTLDNTLTFAAWGTPDGKSIFNKAADADKHAATAITTIDGDIINVSGATFQTLSCSPGDTVLIAGATNNDPFNHDGEFVITEVFDEETIRVRSKSAFDRTFSVSDTPRGLNQDIPGGTSYGTIKVLIGDFISAEDLVFQILPTTLANGGHSVRMLVGSRLQETRLPLADAHRPSLVKSDRRMAELLRIHAITATDFRHSTSAIDGSSQAGSPDSLTADTLENQLNELLNHINNLIAGQITYGGGVSWADGTTNPSTTLEAQVDKIINDLVGSSGSAKISSAARSDWLDGTSNPPTRLDESIDKIITDLALPSGTAKINGSSGGLLTADWLSLQLLQLESEWYNKGRNETITGSSTFTATQLLNPTDDDTACLDTTENPATNSFKLLWQISGGAGKPPVRFYVGDTGIMVMTINALFNPGGLTWSSDTLSAHSSKIALNESGFVISWRAVLTGSWSDTAWDTELVRHHQYNRIDDEGVGYSPEPRAQYNSDDGVSMFNIDHLGFPTTRYSRFSETWHELNGSFVAAQAPKWILFTSGTTSAIQGVLSSSQTTPHLDVTIVNQADDAVELRTRALVNYQADSVIVASWQEQCPVEEAHASCGLGDPFGVESVLFTVSTGASETTWQAECFNGGSSSGKTDTLENTISVRYLKFRIELFGANQPGGARALFYINGVMVAIINSNLPAIGTNLIFSTHYTRLGVTATLKHLKIGQVDVFSSGFTNYPGIPIL